MNILWKMSKVTFREIVTMRTVQPLFKQEALQRLICPPKEPLHQNSNSLQNSALVPASGTDSNFIAPFVEKQMLNQGRSIDQISSSVNHLQDTMSDLKHSFTALRIELNGPSRNMGEGTRLHGQDFDMIATVLKELKSKSEEIEKLKLEIEALKLKNRYMGVPPPHQQDSLSVMNIHAALPEVRSPGLLQAGRNRTIADSFDEDDMVDDFATPEPPASRSQISLNDRNPYSIANGQAAEHAVGSTELHDGIIADSLGNSRSRPAQLHNSQQVVANRPRSDQPIENHHTEGAALPAPPPSKPGRGRPRKSVSQPRKPKSTPDYAGSNPPTGTLRRRQSRRSLHEQSLEPISNEHGGSGDIQPPQDQTNPSHPSPNKRSKHNTGSPSGTRTSGLDEDADEVAMNEKRKAKVAARDVLAKLALQHEEILEADKA